MYEKIKILIKNSLSLSPNLKEKYLKILKFLPQNKLEELLKILEKEQIEVEKLQNELKKEESEINKTYIQKIEEVFKAEYKKSLNEEESKDKEEAENMLKQLDNQS